MVPKNGLLKHSEFAQCEWHFPCHLKKTTSREVPQSIKSKYFSFKKFKVCLNLNLNSSELFVDVCVPSGPPVFLCALFQTKAGCNSF